MKTNEYLAMLYVQSRDLRDATPGDVLELYKQALADINAREGEMFASRRDPAARQSPPDIEKGAVYGRPIQ